MHSLVAFLSVPAIVFTMAGCTSRGWVFEADAVNGPTAVTAIATRDSSTFVAGYYKGALALGGG